MENNNQCIWPADKKGAFSPLFSWRGRSIRASYRHCTLFTTQLPLQLFAFHPLMCPLHYGHFARGLFMSPAGLLVYVLLNQIPFINRKKNKYYQRYTFHIAITWSQARTLPSWIFPSGALWKIPYEYASTPSWCVPDLIAGGRTLVLWSRSLLSTLCCCCCCCCLLPETKGAI